MAHVEQRAFVQAIAGSLSAYFTRCRVLEIGSLDINGSIRDLFNDCNYTGLDVAEGKGVDIVCKGQDYDAPDNCFDIVISCEAMEHNPFWKETFENMVRMCRPGGLIVMTCATYGRKEHGTTRSAPGASPLTAQWNYYRNLGQRDFLRKCDVARLFSAFRFWSNWASYDLYFLGAKCAAHCDTDGFQRAVNHVEQYLETVNNSKRCRYRRFVAQYFGDKAFALLRKCVSMSGLSDETKESMLRKWMGHP